MGMTFIANTDLQLERIPNPDNNDDTRCLDRDDPYASWFRFAHTINGYEAAGSYEACQKTAYNVCAGGEGSLTDLRCSLFCVARAWRFAGIDDTPDEAIDDLLRRIRAKLVAGELD